MQTALKHSLVVLLATGLLVGGFAGTTAGQERPAAQSNSLSMQAPFGSSASQLGSMSCSELHATYKQGVERIRSSDMPADQKRSLIQRATAVYQRYKLQKGC